MNMRKRTKLFILLSKLLYRGFLIAYYGKLKLSGSGNQVPSFSKQKKLDIIVNSNRSEMFFNRKRIAKNHEELSLMEPESVVRDNEVGRCI